MKGAYLLYLVLFIVLAIPLFADQTLVNPVGEFSAISIINSQEVPLHKQEPMDTVFPVLAVGLITTEDYIYYIEGLKQSKPIGKAGVVLNYTYTNSVNAGGARRVKKLGRH